MFLFDFSFWKHFFAILVQPPIYSTNLANVNSPSRQVSSEHIRSIYEKALRKGLLNLLYNLLTLRPCFGCFSPELVETVAKSGSSLVGQGEDDAYVDRKFVGSSANGRNYAGTVRSRKCLVLAKSKIADT